MIRPARHNDLKRITQLENEGHGTNSYQYFFFAQCLDFTPDGFWVKEVGTEVCGFSLFSQNRQSTWILDLAVSKDHQKQGIATELMRHAIELSESDVFLHVNPNNEKALRLYQKLGFEITETRKDFFGPGQHRLIMGYRKS